jgi:hypothetical protein
VVDPGSLTAITLATVRKDIRSIYEQSGLTPNLAVCSPGVFDALAEMFDPTRRYMQDIVQGGRGPVRLDGSARAIDIEGCVFVRDKDCTANAIYYLNTDYIEIEVLPPPPAFQALIERAGVQADDGFGVLFPGELFVIGGEPGADKTTMVWSAALATARGNAHAPGRRVLVFSLEMSGPVLVRRIAGQMAGIPQERLKRGAFYPGEMSKLAGAMNELSALPIQVFDDCDTLDGIAARVRAELLRGEVGLVVIDYLQILRHQGSVRDENRADADRVQAAKRLAVQTDVPFLVVSAINKSAQHRAREGKELSAADAKGSGTEFAANVIFYLMCDDPKDKGARVGVTIQFAKNRDGASAPIPLIFDKPRGVFESVEGVGDREERRAQEAAEHDLINADGGDA